MNSEYQSQDYGYNPSSFGGYCHNCGAQVGDAQFCFACGSKQKYGEPKKIEKNTANIRKPNPPQHKSVEYADSGERFVAFIIDSIIISIIASAISGIAWASSGGQIQFGIVEWVRNVFLALPYFVIMEMKGQTVGKMAMKLKTVDEQTLGEITPLQAFIHSVGKVFFIIIDVIIGLITHEDEEENEQIRLTQRIAKTVVIKVH